MSGFGRDKPVSGHRGPETRGPAERGPVRPFPSRSLHPALPHSHGHAQSPAPAWWPGVRRGLPSLGVALLVVIFGLGVLYWRGAVVGPGGPALVAWRAPGQEAVTLSTERYSAGKASYYEVIEAQLKLFPAQAALAQTTRDQFTSVVQLYKALGGGWNLKDPEWSPADPR